MILCQLRLWLWWIVGRLHKTRRKSGEAWDSMGGKGQGVYLLGRLNLEAKVSWKNYDSRTLTHNRDICSRPQTRIMERDRDPLKTRRQSTTRELQRQGKHPGAPIGFLQRPGSFVSPVQVSNDLWRSMGMLMAR